MSKIRSLLQVKQFSEQILRKYILYYDKRDWIRFIYRGKVSESFMREFQDYFTREDWKELSKFQEMSSDFRREMFLPKEKTI